MVLCGLQGVEAGMAEENLKICRNLTDGNASKRAKTALGAVCDCFISAGIQGEAGGLIRDFTKVGTCTLS
jgi:hypothetical protein